MKLIKPKDLKQKLEKGEVLLVDVREPAEHRGECIAGACLIPLAKLSKKELSSTTKPIVLHCGIGKRSARACEKLLSEDPKLEVYSLEGGLAAWKKAGFSTKCSGDGVLPLERQTQMVNGLIVFLGTIFGALLDPIFYIIPGFMGLGLISAGYTGWCGMAKLIAKMPWNK